MEKFIFSYSKESIPNTFRIIINKFDYKLVFNCPYCAVEWHTKEYSSILDNHPENFFFHCHKERGCGKRCIIVFKDGITNEPS